MCTHNDDCLVGKCCFDQGQTGICCLSGCYLGSCGCPNGTYYTPSENPTYKNCCSVGTKYCNGTCCSSECYIDENGSGYCG